MRPLRLAAALAASLASAPALASEQTRFEPFELHAVTGHGLSAAPALLAKPDGWRPGDAAVLLLRDGREMAPYGVIPALLDSGFAVLEVPADSGGAAASIPWLAAGLAVLRGPAQSGPVVAIGAGEAGRAALLAGEVEADGSFGAGRLRFAAQVRLGPGAPVFAAGLGWGDEAAWPSHARGFCEGLVWALAAQPTPVTQGPGAAPSLAAIERDCLGGLAPVTP